MASTNIVRSRYIHELKERGKAHYKKRFLPRPYKAPERLPRCVMVAYVNGEVRADIAIELYALDGLGY